MRTTIKGGDTEMELTLAAVLTAAGAVATAAIITGIIQVLKTTIPALDAGKEKAMALVLSAIIVVLAIVNGGVFTLPVIFAGVIAWVGIAKLSTGIYDEVSGNDRLLDAGGDSP